MPKLRILIADDEPLARERVCALLATGCPDCEIAGEAASGPDTLALVERLRPDLLLLDIQMPGCDGLDVAARVPAAVRPAIIFVTAHEQFAVAAFAASAVDYLLKPFDGERLRQALGRAFAQLSSQRARELEEKVEALLTNARPRIARRIAVRVDGRVVFIRPPDIVWIEAANNYSVIHLADAKRLMLRETLGALEQRLGAAGFARIHRSAVVRIDQIREFEPTGCGDHLVVLQDGTKLPLSRSLRHPLEQCLTGAE